MDRSAIKSLRRKGMKIAEIASAMGIDRKTVMKVLKQPTEQAVTRERSSLLDPFAPRIRDWIKKKVPVKRMLELLQEGDDPFRGQRSEFYQQVSKIRKQMEQAAEEVFVRFESLPGEYCQFDWGEIREMAFISQPAQTRYFFCARLKFSRMSFVKFTTEMKQETLQRCLLEAFEFFGGVPWNSVFDNMKTVVTGRDDQQKPIWNKSFLKLMFEVESHPLACWPQSGNQKGAVENLVGWVKSNFIPERSFLDDKDLEQQLRAWLERVNSAVSQAHGKAPIQVWRDFEVGALSALKVNARDFGMMREVCVGNESLVNIDSNRYSVPAIYVKSSLLARVRLDWIDLYDKDKLVAHHARAKSKLHKPIRIPEHYESVLKTKPRARVMLYRDHLMQADKSVAAYLNTLCFRERGSFGPQILKMYALLEKHGSEELGTACAVASEHDAYGVEYLENLLMQPKLPPNYQLEHSISAPTQCDVDRNPAEYEAHVRESLVS